MLAPLIKAHALAWAIAEASEEEIDKHNILQASMLAMRRAVEALKTVPTLALIDGNRCPVMKIQSIAVIGGDDKVDAISAASILAKTARDAALVPCTRSIRSTASTSTRATAPRCTWSACASTAHRRCIAVLSRRCAK
jgi:ribonuclease HII